MAEPGSTSTNPPALGADEIQRMVGAIRSVQENLQRRAEQSHGMITILWGVIVFSIMTFYQILEYTRVEWMHDMADYAWLMFVTIGLLATSLVGGTFDRAASGPPRLYAFWHTMIFVAIGTIAVIVLITTDQVRRIPGFWLLFFPVFSYNRHPIKQWNLGTTLSVIGIVSGLYVLIWSPVFGWTIGALFYLVGLGILGLRAYRNPEPAS